MVDNAILYIACGDTHIDKAIQSKQSFMEHHNNIDSVIIADRYIDGFDRSFITDLNVEHIQGRNWLIESIIYHEYLEWLSDYDNILFLDNDTYVCDNVDEIFRYLNLYDICMARREWHIYDNGIFSGLNCGVIAFRNNANIKRLFIRWEKKYHEQITNNKKYTDQPVFNEVIKDMQSTVNLYILPNTYNLRTPMGYVKGKVKILHGKGDLPKISGEINQDYERRIYTKNPSFKSNELKVKRHFDLLYHIEYTLRKHGIITMSKVGLTYLYDKLTNSNKMEQYKYLDLGN